MRSAGRTACFIAVVITASFAFMATDVRAGQFPQCGDQKDNDADGKADFVGGDPGCVDALDDDESNPPTGPTCDLGLSTCMNVPDATSCVDGVCISGKTLQPIAGTTCTCKEIGKCAADFSCGAKTGDGAAACPQGQKVEWSADGTVCALQNGNGACFRCIDDSAPGGQPNDPAPMCPVNCDVDLDCGTQTQCSKVQLPDGTKTNADLCWMDPDAKMCVKKCLVPRCISKKCELAPPVEGSPGFPYVPCGTDQCGPPRCGDGVTQAGEDAKDPGGLGNGQTCDIFQSTCTNVPGATACKDGVCISGQTLKPIPGTTCTCSVPLPRPKLDCSNGYRTVSGKLSPTPSCAGGWYIQGPDKTCNCIMAALPGASPLAPVASLLGGSSLLASSIINNCSVSCVRLTCGPGDACFALMGWNTVMQQCAPADCAGREEECGMPDQRYGASMKSWEMCPGTAVDPPDDDPVDPTDPPGTPSPEDGEECDDANNAANDGCSPTCKKERCGDGTVQQKGADGKPNTADDEKCDDGNLEVGDGCSNTCAIESCGNGVHDQGEECDDGAKNSDTAPGACRTDCTLPKCNDGVVDVRKADAGFDEQCDCGPDAEGGACDIEFEGRPARCEGCRLSYCGDGFQDNDGIDGKTGTLDDELCDAGPFNSDGLPAGAACENAAQCKGLPCVNGQCTQTSCTSSADCSGGLKCVKGMCRPGGCTSDAECVAGTKCDAYGNCSACTLNSDCASGLCYPNAQCAPMDLKLPDPKVYGCRLDCKPARCGDGIKDTAVGETCDEGVKMMKCNGFPQPACDCAVPTWGNPPFDTTCCPQNQYCSIWPTETCPVNCGVASGTRPGECHDGLLPTEKEMCDVYQALGSTDSKTGKVLMRPNRDGANDGWIVNQPTIEKMYVTVDHAPVTKSGTWIPNAPGASPDGAFIRSTKDGASMVFHLWDAPTLAAWPVTSVSVRVSADFTGTGKAWILSEAQMLPIRNRPPITVGTLNDAVLKVVALPGAKKLEFRLLTTSTREELLSPASVVSSVAMGTNTKIDVDALEIVINTAGPTLDKALCPLCQYPRCGDMIEQDGEGCDDGNNDSNDGCSDKCQAEICALPVGG